MLNQSTYLGSLHVYESNETISLTCEKLLFLAMLFLDILFTVRVALVVILAFQLLVVKSGTTIFGMSIFVRWKGSVMAMICNVGFVVGFRLHS